MAAPEIERLIKLIGRLPGLGPRSARRAALSLMKHRESLMRPLLEVLEACRDKVAPCRRCGNLDTSDPCAVCTDPQRVKSVVCVVQEVEDLWAMERSSAYRGQFHVLGGTLSALDGRGPDNLAIGSLLARVEAGGIEEVILALGATVDGQTTAHYLAERLRPFACSITRLAHGLPLGGELNYLDQGTLDAALQARARLD
ncbi:MAG: recombination protein RecR [Geminicoccaceae bacterium]|nr:recombination protein RecR [Geminicoccaceae bacterium]